MRSFLLAFLLLPLAVTGCDSAGSADGSLRVMLTDAPGDFVRAVVTVDSVVVQGEGGAVVLRDEPATVDLLTLQNEVMELVGETDLPAGTYSQLRLVIGGAFVEVEGEGGDTSVFATSEAYAASQGVEADGALQTPSYAQSGLKVNLPGVTVDGDERVVLLDFDVSESFGREAGQSGRWVMTPVVRATDFELTGTVEVDLTLAAGVALPTGSLADFSATVDKGGDVVAVPFEDADGDGTFTAEIRYLAPGTYSVGVAGPEALTFAVDPAPLAVEVESGATATYDLALTTASVEL